jgi:uncharacterized protein YjbI with pentapeptide repeats
MQKSEDQKGKEKRRFSQEQYDILKRCSEKKDMTEWNEWRKENTKEYVLLEGANFKGFWLARANFMKGTIHNDKTGEDIEYSGEVHFEGSNFEFANLERANFFQAHVEESCFWHVRGREAQFVNAHLEDADLSVAHLEESNFHGASLRNADIISSWLTMGDFTCADLRGCWIRGAVVDGATKFWTPEVNRYSKRERFTDFSGTQLDSVRIDVGTKQLLEYNVRRMNWEEWYKEHWIWRWPFQIFWFVSDYGISGKRVFGIFIILAFLFAAVYMNWAYWAPPGVVSNLIVQPEAGEAGWHYLTRAMIRPIYFSVVTMTTLGFGDMYANKGSIAGHVLLILQVILGYVLLGALVTRFAVLFTAGGPAGKFAKKKKK